MALPRHPQGERSSPPIDGSMQHKTVRFGSLEPVLITLAKQVTLPLATILVLAVCMLVGRQPLSIRFFGLALVAFLIAARIFSPLDLRQTGRWRARKVAPRILLEWSCVFAILVFLTIAFGRRLVFPEPVMLGWYRGHAVALLIVDSLSLPIARWLASGVLGRGALHHHRRQRGRSRTRAPHRCRARERQVLRIFRLPKRRLGCRGPEQSAGHGQLLGG